jgi:hypothetical protein
LARPLTEVSASGKARRRQSAAAPTTIKYLKLLRQSSPSSLGARKEISTPDPQVGFTVKRDEIRGLAPAP